MTTVTVDGLLEISNRNSSSKGIVHQDGLTKKGTNRPNPPRQINVIDQTQLESPASLGPNLEIPDFVGNKIILDDTFPLTKSFKVGLSSTLDMSASTPNNTLISSASILFENTNPVNDVLSVTLNNLLLAGDGTNSVFDIHGSLSALVRFIDVIFANFDSMGTTDTGAVIINSSVIQGFAKGLIVNEPVDVIINSFGIVQFAPLGITALSFIAGVIPVNASLENIRGLSFFLGDSLFFIDPNSPPGSFYTIEKSLVVAGDFYQQGVDVAISSITDNAGKAVFNTVSNHNLEVDSHTKLKNFVTQVQLNTKHIVTVVASPTSFETGVPFVANDTTGVLPNRPVNIISVANNGSGKTRYTTDVSHGLRVGKLTVIREFGVATTYNKTDKVTLVDTPLTGTTFDTDTDFDVDDIGIMDSASLDQTSPLVTAKNNQGQEQSMIQGNARVKPAGIIVASSPSTPVPLEDLSPTVGDYIENPDNELIFGNPTTGEFIYEGLFSTRAVLTYTVAASPDGGGSQVLVFALFRDKGAGYVEVPNTRTTLDTSTDTTKEFTADFFNMDPGDRFRLFKVSNTGSNDTNINDGTKITLLGEQ